MATNAVAAADTLNAGGIAATVVVVASVNPAPVDDLVAVLRSVPLVVTVEAHYINGGLGSLVAEVIAEHELDCRLVRAGIRHCPQGVTGSPEYLYERLGISERRLVALITRTHRVGHPRLVLP